MSDQLQDAAQVGNYQENNKELHKGVPVADPDHRLASDHTLPLQPALRPHGLGGGVLQLLLLIAVRGYRHQVSYL